MAESVQSSDIRQPTGRVGDEASPKVIFAKPGSSTIQQSTRSSNNTPSSGRQYRKPKVEKDNDVSSSSLELKSPQQTVLRLKRRVEDSPSKVLLMSYCKRRKNDKGGFDATSVGALDGEDQGDTCTSVFTFAGTVAQNTDEPSNVAEVIRKALTEVNSLHAASKENVKHRDVKLAAKTKETVKKNSLFSRFKVVSNKRGIDESDLDLNSGVNDSKLCYNMLDLVADSTDSTNKTDNADADNPLDPETICVNGVPMIKEKDYSNLDTASSDIITKSAKESGFVFDLYVTSKAIPTNQICDKYVSVAYEDEWDFGKGQYEMDSDEEIQIPEDDDDSNDEGNWRNDYPDSDPDSESDMFYGKKTTGYGDEDDEDEDFLVDRFGEFKIRGDEELSSDDNEDEIYTLENHGEDDLVGESTMMSMYHKYKARVAREMNISSEVVSSPSASDSE